MPTAATRQLLRRHAVAFGVSFVCLTTLLLTQAIVRLPKGYAAASDPRRDGMAIDDRRQSRAASEPRRCRQAR